jgi:hypothetical protein
MAKAMAQAMAQKVKQPAQKSSLHYSSGGGHRAPRRVQRLCAFCSVV